MGKNGELGAKILRESSEFITEEAVAKSSAKLFPKGSVAIAMYGATIGKTSILGIDATTNQACGVGQPITQLTTTEFLYYFLCNEKDNFIAKGKGGAQPNISQGLIKEHKVVLPPLAEQQQIASKLDELLAQVDIIKTRLDTIPKILKRFRQAVLAAAVNGKLTEEWRRENGIVPPSETNLVSLVQFKQGTQVPSLEQVEEPQANYVKFLRIINFTQGSSDFKYVPINKSNRIIAEDDIAMVRYGATAGHVGRGLAGVLANNLFVIEPGLRLQKSYLYEFLRSPIFQDKVFRMVKGGAMPAISFKLFDEIKIYLPVPEEQTEIVRQIEQLLAYADQIEQRVKDAQARVNHLTQSILAKAFRGELTTEWREQNPELISGENSAEALLAKIKAVRETIAATKKIGKKVKT